MSLLGFLCSKEIWVDHPKNASVITAISETLLSASINGNISFWFFRSSEGEDLKYIEKIAF